MCAKRIYSALVMMGTLIILMTTAGAQSLNPFGWRWDSSPLEGTWVVTVNPISPPPGFPSSFTALETYSRGGGMVTTNNITSGPRPGQGAWENGGLQYTVTILFFTFDQSGVQNGSIRVRHSLSLQGGDAYSGQGQADFLDPAGNLLFSFHFTTQGRRLSAEWL